MKIYSKVLFFFLPYSLFFSCTIAPQITYLDTPTQMEMDSIGVWDDVDLENDFILLEKGPARLDSDLENPRRKKILNILQGEFVEKKQP